MFESELMKFAQEHETVCANNRTEIIQCGSEAVYVGEVKDGKPHGKGRYIWKDGRYEDCYYINGVEQQ